MSSVNERLQDRAIRHAVALQRYGKGLSDRLVQLLNTADADIVRLIGERLVAIEERGFDTGPATTARLQNLLQELRALNSAVYASLAGELDSELIAFASAEAAGQATALQTALTVQLGTSLPTPDRLAAIVRETPMQGYLLKPWVEGMETARVDRIEQAIRLGLLEGENTDQIVRRIRGTKAGGYRDGVLEISRRSAQTMVRTAVSHVSNAAAQETWKANSRYIRGWQFLATLDGRTTVTCAGLSGQVFDVGTGPMPPRHPSCRSISVPVTKTFREMGIDRDEVSPGTRASMDGQVAGDTTFKDWLVRKGEATQNQILGPTRAELFRSGKLDLNQFIRADGSVLTLEELKQLYPSLLQ